jgi:hypothetical protein
MKIIQPPKFEVWSHKTKLKEYETELKSFLTKKVGWYDISLAIFQPINSSRRGAMIRIGHNPYIEGSISCEMRGDFCEICIKDDEIAEGLMNLLSLPYDSKEGA